MTGDPAGAAGRLVETAPGEVVSRIREALEQIAAEAGLALSAEELDRLAAQGIVYADGRLWRRALAAAAVDELGLGLAEAAAHPAVRDAQERLGAPAYPGDWPEPPVEPVRVPAVHLGGIEALNPGERDIELRFSTAGLDVLRRSSGAPIGRLEWDEVRSVELPRRRGLRPGRRRLVELHVATDRGRASFELPDVSEEQLTEHVEPIVARARGGHNAAG